MQLQDLPLEKFNHKGCDIAFRRCGKGPAILCLHGYPQTHLWHKIAPALAEYYTVILPDLRGYGDSGKPETDTQHSPYSKRVMAADMAALMAYCGFKYYDVIGHDRGGRVAHRLARDYRSILRVLACLILPPHWICMKQPTRNLQRHIITGSF